MIDAAIYKAQMHDMRWGVDDCCCFVAAIVKAHGGPDLLAPFAPWDSEEGATQSLASYGGGGLLEAAMKRAAELALERVAGPRPGTIGLVTNDAGHMLALGLDHKWLVRTKSGVAYARPGQTILAWNVPCLPR